MYCLTYPVGAFYLLYLLYVLMGVWFIHFLCLFVQQWTDHLFCVYPFSIICPNDSMKYINTLALPMSYILWYYQSLTVQAQLVVDVPTYQQKNKSMYCQALLLVPQALQVQYFLFVEQFSILDILYWIIENSFAIFCIILASISGIWLT